ncbi:MAG: hypothetical protein H6811_11065 [Phycisphaeraceae bacterium]|nr:hypothetical protein [Phycisphaeraceae bacterium]
MPTRREFHRFAGAALGAAAFAPFVRGADKAGRRAPILGEGDWRFECLHDWLAPPMGMAFGDTHGLAQDRAGRIYLAHTVHPTSESPDAVCVFSPAGEFIKSWGSVFRGGAHGLDIREEGGEEFLYHCDINRRRLVKTNLGGEVLWERGMPREAEVYTDQAGWCPTNVAFHPDGDIFVGDGYGSSYIHRYTRDGGYAQTIAGPGSGKGQVSCPHGLWVDDRSGSPLLVVADRSNRRIQYLTLNGEHVGFVSEGVRLPCHFSFRDGVMLVPDLESVVTLFDTENRVLAQLGDGHPSSLRGAPREQFIEGKFIHPHDAIWLASGDILVAEWVPIGRVTLLRRLG